MSGQTARRGGNARPLTAEETAEYAHTVGLGGASRPVGYLVLPGRLAAECVGPLVGMRTTGRCMEPAILDGELIVVDGGRTPAVGDIVVFDDFPAGLLAKRLTAIDDDWLTLSADAPGFPTFRLVPEYAAESIRGVVVYTERDLDRLSSG